MSRPPKSGPHGKPETRDALIAAAAVEFAECGLDGASLNAICARAGFTRGAFYVHFRDREDLLVAVMDHMLGGFVEGLVASSSDQGADLERIVTIIAFAIASSAYPVRGTHAMRFHHVLAACDRSPAVGERYAKVLQQAVAGVARAVEAAQSAGRARVDLDAQTLADLLVVNTLGLIAASEVGMPADAQAIARTLLALIAPLPAGA